jgi:hypothetical protein
MSFATKAYKVRLVLGFICLIAGIAFMAHSFLEPKVSPIIKPSVFKDYKHLGAISYRQLHPKLSEKAILVFVVNDFSTEKDIILGALESGQKLDEREYILITNENSWSTILSQEFSFKGISPTEEALESDSFVAPTYVVLIHQQDYFTKPPVELNLGAEFKAEYQTYTLVNLEIAKTGAGSFKCPNRKRAFLLKSETDLDCFQLWMEKLVYRKRKNLDLTKTIGALDQVHLKHYLVYYSK